MVAELAAQGKEIFQWGEKFVDITELEKLVYQAIMAFGREIMRQCMEQADNILALQRDRNVLRDKGYRTTTLKTIMGEVTYRRHVYLVSWGHPKPSTCWTRAWVLTHSSIFWDLLMFLSSCRLQMPVAKVMVFPDGNGYYVCPRCRITMEREFMSFCDRCGQHLGWKGYKKARKIYPGQHCTAHT